MEVVKGGDHEIPVLFLPLLGPGPETATST